MDSSASASSGDPQPEFRQEQLSIPCPPLPYPAVKVVIGQHFHFSLRSPRFWGWLIVVAFYDADDNQIWNREVFLCHRDERGWSPDSGEFDTGPAPPAFLLQGRLPRPDEDIGNINVSNFSVRGHSFDIRNGRISATAPAPISNQLAIRPFPLGIGQQVSTHNSVGSAGSTSSEEHKHRPYSRSGSRISRHAPSQRPASTAQPNMNPYTSGGGNPTFGRDNGPLPPNAQQPGGMPMVYPGGAQPAYYSHPGYAPYAYPPMQPQLSPYGYPTAALPGRPAQTYPAVDPNMPAANMTNSTGGVGCEPGYNYFFPTDHTKIHVLKSGSTPPWQLPAGHVVPFHACHVPSNTTLRELLRGFGATNANPAMNAVTECCQGGGGKWYKGIALTGDDKGRLDKPIKDFGWDATRTGLAGDKSVVSLYVTRG